MTLKEFFDKEVSYTTGRLLLISIIIVAITIVASIAVFKKTELRNKRLTIKEQCKEKSDLFASQAMGYFTSRTPITEGTLFLKTECKELYDSQIRSIEDRVNRIIDSDEVYKTQILVLSKQLEAYQNYHKKVTALLEAYFKQKLQKD